MPSPMLTHKRALIAAAVLLAAGALLLFLLPDEKTLGPVVKVVVLHGALVQAGLYAFLAAGILGLAWLVTRRDGVFAWCTATQKTAIVVWIAYVLSSMVATWMAWGQWIAWDEPRVRSSAYVLILALAALALHVVGGRRALHRSAERGDSGRSLVPGQGRRRRAPSVGSAWPVHR